MWMQLLEASGFPPIGSAFPRNWESTIKDANPSGFYESDLRTGIYYATNPHPKSGAYLFPEDTRRHAVKVFIPGLIRTDRAFIHKVIATIRPWRQYVRSLNRLYEMEREAKAKLKSAPEDIPEPVVMPPLIEWWVENFSLISDIVTRRYPFFMVAYESVLQNPEETLRDVFRWIGEGDVEAAIAGVNPELRTQNEEVGDQPEESNVELEPEVTEVFDALYEVVRTQSPLEQAFIERLNETNRLLGPRIDAVVKETARGQLERRRLLQARRMASEDAEPGS